MEIRRKYQIYMQRVRCYSSYNFFFIFTISVVKNWNDFSKTLGLKSFKKNCKNNLNFANIGVCLHWITAKTLCCVNETVANSQWKSINQSINQFCMKSKTRKKSISIIHFFFITQQVGGFSLPPVSVSKSFLDLEMVFQDWHSYFFFWVWFIEST